MIWEIAFVIFLLSLTILIYLLIPSVLKLREMLSHASKTLAIVNEDLPDIVKNVKQVSGKLDDVLNVTERTVEDIAQIEHMISKEIKQPLQNIAQVVGTLIQILNKIFYRSKK